MYNVVDMSFEEIEEQVGLSALEGGKPMTIAERLREEGKTQGIAEGEERSRIATARAMLA